MGQLPTSIEDRIFPEPNSGCWFWMGQVNQDGYGRIRIGKGRSQVAHRYIYEMHHGVVVPADLQVDHLCRVRSCVNPDHLEPVTRSLNVRRAFRANGKASHCEHEMTPANTYRYQNRNGKVECRQCRAARRKSAA